MTIDKIISRRMSARGLNARLGRIHNTRADMNFMKTMDKLQSDKFENSNKNNTSLGGSLKQFISKKIDKMLDSVPELKTLD